MPLKKPTMQALNTKLTELYILRESVTEPLKTLVEKEIIQTVAAVAERLQRQEYGRQSRAREEILSRLQALADKISEPNS